MRSAAHAWVRRWWRGDAGLAGAAMSLTTAPAAWAYRAVLAHRNRRFAARAIAAPEGLAVVSVGNLVVGGTGKTPVAAWVARTLLEAGHRPALLTRGYGADEVALHERWNPTVRVLVDADRVRAARRAREGGHDCAVLDDGFQHRRLRRDLDVVLLAAEDPLGGPLLPRGPFREPLAALARADVLVVTRRAASAERAGEVNAALRARFPAACVGTLALEPGGWAGLDGARATAPEGPLLALSAIARPDTVRAALERLGYSDVVAVNFPDHHEYTAADLRRALRAAGDRTLVVTEKDAMKLRSQPLVPHDARVLCDALRWEDGETALRRRLVRTVADHA